MIDKHTIAIVSIVGSSLDVLGALYLAYDLLGGEHGPLRTLTRAVTYGLLFAIGFGLALGPVFGAANGMTLSLELSRAARNQPVPRFSYEMLMSGIRAFGFGMGAAYLFGLAFGISFGILSILGQAVAYQRGVRPSIDYAPGRRLRMSRQQAVAAVVRTVGYTLAAYVSAWISHQHARALPIALHLGLTVGVVTAIANLCMPIIEWTADHMPQRRMGVIGVGCILIGFTLQSVQYWIALLE